jgi:hypothetical protein
MSSLLLLAVTACSSEPAQVGSSEGAMPSKTSASREAAFVATNTSEELAFLASRVCLPQVTSESAGAVGDLRNALTSNGYRLASDQVSRELFGEVVPGFVAARKESELGRFKIAYGTGLPVCAVLLTDDSVVPPVADLRTAFESQGWKKVHMGAVAPERLPYAGFKRTDRNGKTILAVLNDEPDSDPEVRLGIDISYADF